MPDPNVEESAWQRAKRDAARVYPSTPFEVAATLGTIILGSVAAVASAGEDTTIQIAVPILGGTFALVFAFLIVLGFQCLAAPIRQRDELRAAWDVGEVAKPLSIEVLLSNERRKATGFYRIQRGSIVMTSADRGRAEDWTNRVVELLSEHVDAAAAKEFIDASQGQPSFKRQLDAQASALDKIIERLAAG